tara:strand:+ start:458 stop:940 length:483 start_codon:yes stop_codon:yes gene_type:complete
MYKNLLSLIQPYLVIIINAMIPTFVDLTLKAFKGYLTRSDRDKAKMKRIFFFVTLNTLILPLVTESSAMGIYEDFSKRLAGNGTGAIFDLPTLISSNLMSQQYFYIKFILSSAFVTNAINLLDMPHKSAVAIGSRLHKRKQKNAKIKTDYVDEREFEMGY